MPFLKPMMEGRQGKHRFFTGNLTVGEFRQMAIFPDDPTLAELDEDQQMQRALSKKRIQDMVAYLTDYGDHFYNALALVILPGDLNGAAKEAQPGSEAWDFYFERDNGSSPVRRTTGVLHISGEARLFTADGQHRGQSLVAAVTEQSKLAREDIPVVLIPFESFDQVRQLFSDLNRNAKPVSKSISLEYDARDPVVKLAKHVAEAIPLFVDRVNRVSNSLSRSSAKVITLGSIDFGTREILAGVAGGTDITQWARDHARTAETLVTDAWGAIVEAFHDEWLDVLNGEEGAAGKVRDEFVFAHGLGWQALARALGQLIKTLGEERGFEYFREAVNQIDWRRTNEATWGNIAVIYTTDETGQVTNRVNNTGPGIRATADVVIAKAEKLAGATQVGA